MNDVLNDSDLPTLKDKLQRHVEGIVSVLRELKRAGHQGDQHERNAVYALADLLRVDPELLNEFPLTPIPGELGRTHKILSEGTTRSGAGKGDVKAYVTLTISPTSTNVQELVFEGEPPTIGGWLNRGEEDRGTFRDPRQVLSTLSHAIEQWAQDKLDKARNAERAERTLELAREIARLVR